MKKVIFSLGLCLCVGFTAMAQDMVIVEETESPAFVNKRGISLLPQAGDFAIGIEATPFLEYVGNFFNQSGTNKAPLFEGRDFTIYGKYFMEDNRAIRARLTLNIGSTADKGVVRNDEEVANNPLNADATVIDVAKYNSTDVMLSAGYEFRRGRGRVQGFYGGEVLLGYGSGKNKYEYANPMTAVNQIPTSYNFDGNWNSTTGTRTTEKKYGNTFAGGIGAFVGVEYFFAPQISIGGEFNIGFLYSSTSQTETTTETWNASANSIQTQTNRSGSWEAQDVGFYTKPEGHIFLMFHF